MDDDVLVSLVRSYPVIARTHSIDHYTVAADLGPVLAQFMIAIASVEYWSVYVSLMGYRQNQPFTNIQDVLGDIQYHLYDRGIGAKPHSAFVEFAIIEGVVDALDGERSLSVFLSAASVLKHVMPGECYLTLEDASRIRECSDRCEFKYPHDPDQRGVCERKCRERLTERVRVESSVGIWVTS